MFRSAIEIKEVKTSDLPIKKDPFIVFEIIDKTLPNYINVGTIYYRNYERKSHINQKKKYVVYVNPNSDENPAEMWGIQPTTATSYTVTSRGKSSIKPDALHDVVVSLYVQINKCTLTWCQIEI